MIGVLFCDLRPATHQAAVAEISAGGSEDGRGKKREEGGIDDGSDRTTETRIENGILSKASQVKSTNKGKQGMLDTKTKNIHAS